MSIPTIKVYFRNGKFNWTAVTINRADYDPALHSTDAIVDDTKVRAPTDEIEFPAILDTKRDDLMDEAREVQSDLEEMIAKDENDLAAYTKDEKDE